MALVVCINIKGESRCRRTPENTDSAQTSLPPPLDNKANSPKVANSRCSKILLGARGILKIFPFYNPNIRWQTANKPKSVVARPSPALHVTLRSRLVLKALARHSPLRLLQVIKTLRRRRSPKLPLLRIVPRRLVCSTSTLPPASRAARRRPSPSSAKRQRPFRDLQNRSPRNFQ